MEQSAHKLTLWERNRLSLSGVDEVVSFDENAVVLHTCMGTLTIQGQGLHLKTLSLEGGQVEVDGEVSSLSYEDPGTNAGWLQRLFQ